MLVFRNHVTEPIEYPINHLDDLDKILFFDIETTGFSRKHCFIYIIGCMYYVGDSLMYTQWLAENKNDEANVLMAFYQFMQPFRTIIHFNGTSFDLPFVCTRGDNFHLNFDFNTKNQIDIYQYVSKIFPLFSLQNKKQKTLEDFLGISRIDPFNGGELIELYRAYITSKDEKLLLPLLLHNKEDVWNMGKLISLLSYADIFLGKYTVDSFQILELSTTFEAVERKLSVDLKLEYSVPKPIQYFKDDITFLCNGSKATLLLPETMDTFKYFFENYKDYFYLPMEDRAIHKSLAQFVDSKYRKKATKDTCYEKVTGSFLPIYNQTNLIQRTYMEKINDKKMYLLTKDLNSENIAEYTQSILNHLFSF